MASTINDYSLEWKKYKTGTDTDQYATATARETDLEWIIVEGSDDAPANTIVGHVIDKGTTEGWVLKDGDRLWIRGRTTPKGPTTVFTG